MKLPSQPTPPSPEIAAKSKTVKKIFKKKNTKKLNECCSFTGHDTQRTPYRLSSFDARRIIYPGSNYDPWWDMP